MDVATGIAIAKAVWQLRILPRVGGALKRVFGMRKITIKRKAEQVNKMEILKANIGSIIRLILGILGGCGIVISTQETDAVIQGITQVVAGVSILAPAIWAIIKNWKAAKAK